MLCQTEGRGGSSQHGAKVLGVGFHLFTQKFPAAKTLLHTVSFQEVVEGVGAQQLL